MKTAISIFNVDNLNRRSTLFTIIIMLFAVSLVSGCMGGSSSEPVELEKEISNIPPGTSGVAFSISDSATGAGLSEARTVIMKEGTLDAMKMYKTGSDSSVISGLSSSQESAIAYIADTDMTTSGSMTAYLAPGTYDARIQRPAYEDYVINSIKIEGTNVIAAAYDIKMESIDSDQMTFLGACEGFVKASNGSLVEGALISISSKSGIYNTASDEKGYWRIFNIPAGDYNGYAAFAGYKSAQLSGQKVSAGITKNFSTFILQQAVLHTIKGKVVSNTGAAVSGISIQLQNIDTNQPLMQSAVSATDGTFSVSGIEAGEFNVYFGLNLAETYYPSKQYVMLGYENVSTGSMQSTIQAVNKPLVDIGNVVVNKR